MCHAAGGRLITNGTARGRIIEGRKKRSGHEGEWSAGHSACGWLERASFRADGFEERKPEQHDPAWHGGNRPGQMVRGWSDRRGATGRCGALHAEWGAPHAVGAVGKAFPRHCPDIRGFESLFILLCFLTWTHRRHSRWNRLPQISQSRVHSWLVTIHNGL